MTDEDLRARLAALIGELTERMREPAVPIERQEQERALDYAKLMLAATDHEEREAVGLKGGKAPRAFRSPARLDAAMAHVHVVTDVLPWQVWVRWDDIPPGSDELRRDVISLASYWRDISLGRSLGAPRKSRED